MIDLAVDRRPNALLMPLLGAVFVVFLVTGLALPVLPLHVVNGLGMDAFVVGLVSGAQFAAALISRVWAGSHSDRHGAKRAVLLGLSMAIGAGLLYLVSAAMIRAPLLSVSVLIAGRAVLGAAESFIIVGAQSWGLGLAGKDSAGRVIAWMGTAMYAALAIGAPVGTALYGWFGFAAIGVTTVAIPLVTVALVAPLPAVPPTVQQKSAMGRVARAVLVPGIGLGFACLGLGAVSAFSVLLFVDRGWQPAWAGFSVFAIAFIAARLTLGHLPDRIGGAKVAAIFAMVQALGLFVLWASPWVWGGLIGAALTGFGFSLVYPGLGIEAVNRAPPENRGLAMGVFTAFLDLSLGVSSPLLGLLAKHTGLGSVFLVSGLFVVASVSIAVVLVRQSRA